MKKKWIALTSVGLGSGIIVAATAAIIVNQQPQAITPIYDYYFNQPIVKQISPTQYQLMITGAHLSQFNNKPIQSINLIDFTNQKPIDDQVANWTNFELVNQNLVLTINLKQVLKVDLYFAINFQVAPSNAFAFNPDQIPYRQLSLGTWSFYQNPDLIKIVQISTPTTSDYQNFQFQVSGQNLDQLVKQIEQLVTFQLIVANEVDSQPFQVRLKPIVRDLKTTYYLEITLDHPLKIHPNTNLNWFQFRTLVIKPTLNFAGFSTSFNRQPILVNQNTLVNIDQSQSTIKQIHNQIEIGQVDNYYYYQVDLVATNLDLITNQINQSNFNVFPLINYQNEAFVIDYQSSEIIDNHWRFQIKTTQFINQSGWFNFNFNPDQAIIADHSIQLTLKYNYQIPEINDVQLINDPSDHNRFYLQLNGLYLRNWLWSQWKQSQIPIISIKLNEFKIVSSNGKIFYPFRENLNPKTIRFSIKDPHDYQNPDDQNWDQPTIYSIDPLVIDPEIKVAPGSNWEFSFPEVATQLVRFAVSEPIIDPDLDPTYQPIQQFAIKSKAKFSQHFVNATNLDDQALDQSWIIVQLIKDLDQYFYVEGDLDPNWNWEQHFKITNRHFDPTNGILSFNLTITNAFDNQSDLVLAKPLVWSGFKTIQPIDYDYQFSLVAPTITLQLNQNEQDWSAISDYLQWNFALKQLVYRKWEQIFHFSGNLDPLWKIEQNLQIDQIRFQSVDQNNQLYQVQFRIMLNFPQANQSRPLIATISLNNIYLMQPKLEWKITNNDHLQIDQNVVINDKWLVTNYYQQWFTYQQIASIDQLMKMLEVTINNNQAIIKINGINPITNLKEQNPVSQIINWDRIKPTSTPHLDRWHLRTNDSLVEIDFSEIDFDPTLLFYEKWDGDLPQLNSFNFKSFNKQQMHRILNSQIDQIFQESFNQQPTYNSLFYFGNQIGATNNQPPLLDFDKIDYNPMTKMFSLNVTTGVQTIANLKDQVLTQFKWNFRWNQFSNLINNWWKVININDVFKQNEIVVNNINWPHVHDYETGLALYLRAQVVMQFDQYLAQMSNSDHSLSSFELLRFDQRFAYFDSVNHQVVINFEYQDLNGWHRHEIIFKGFNIVNIQPPSPNRHFIANSPQKQWSFLGKNLWRLNQGWLEWLFPLFFKNYIENGFAPFINEWELDFQISLNQSGGSISGYTVIINKINKRPFGLELPDIDPIVINSSENVYVTISKKEQLNQIWINQLHNASFVNYHQDLTTIKPLWIKAMIKSNQLDLGRFNNYWWLLKLDQQVVNEQIKPVFSIASVYDRGQANWDQFQFQLDFALMKQPVVNQFHLVNQSISVSQSQFDLETNNFDYQWLKNILWTNGVNITNGLNHLTTYQSWSNWFVTNVQTIKWIDSQSVQVMLSNQQKVVIKFNRSFNQVWSFRDQSEFEASAFVNLPANPNLEDLIKTNWHLFIELANEQSALKVQDYNQILSAKVLTNEQQQLSLQIIIEKVQYDPSRGGWVGSGGLTKTFIIKKSAQTQSGYYQFAPDFPLQYQFTTPQPIDRFNDPELIKTWLIETKMDWFSALNQPDQLDRHLRIDQLVINDQSVIFQISLFNQQTNVQRKTLTLTNLFLNPYQFAFKATSLTIKTKLNQTITPDLIKSWLINNIWLWLEITQGQIPFLYDYWNQIAISNYKLINQNHYQVTITLFDANYQHQSIKTSLELFLVEN